MKKKINSKFLSIAALGILTTSLAATVGLSSDTRIDESIKARAHRIFEYDKNHHLPSHQLYALSIAIQFGDRDGAKSAVERLEPLVR